MGAPTGPAQVYTQGMGAGSGPIAEEAKKALDVVAVFLQQEQIDQLEHMAIEVLANKIRL